MGARYPWESALTGAEVCPAVAEDVRDQEVNPLQYFFPFYTFSIFQVHISADISLGLRLALELGVDKGWWREERGGHTACQVEKRLRMIHCKYN